MGTNNKTIAKNTIFLYIRMMVIMIVSLYTSRVVLQVLGIDDYGIYQAVGGIVGFLSFLNSALSTGTSRFLTYELGSNNRERLKRTFSTTLTIHVLLALLIVLLGETLGLWYFNNKMVIPADRFDAAAIVFQVSIVIAVLSIVTVPYRASIISHEKMKVFAYVGILEAISKLGIVFLLSYGEIDKLVLYSVLLLIIQVILLSFYVYYCCRNFKETEPKLYIDKELFKQIFSFSGWSLFANGAIALNSQGILLLLNYFFSPAIVAARAISLQVYNAAIEFVNNFRTAANPQIVKLLASGDIEASHKLLLESTKYSYYLMLVLALPICLLASPLLNIWLVEVPDYAVPFLQLVIIQSLFQVFDTSFYTALYALGRIKENALISPTLGFIRFPIVFLLFKIGCSPLALSWASLVTYAILGFVIKPILINKIADYKWKDIFEVYWKCFTVTLAAVPVPLLLYYKIDNDTMANGVIILAASIVSVAMAVWIVGLDKSMRKMLVRTVKNRLSRKKK